MRISNAIVIGYETEVNAFFCLRPLQAIPRETFADTNVKFYCFKGFSYTFSVVSSVVYFRTFLKTFQYYFKIPQVTNNKKKINSSTDNINLGYMWHGYTHGCIFHGYWEKLPHLTGQGNNP